MKIPYAGRCIDEIDKVYMRSAVEDGVLTAGRFTEEFEMELAKKVGRKYAFAVNSGSSANLLALSALTHPSIPNHLKPGDKVITLAAGFPTTVNPIIQLGMIPVFVDIDLGTLNINLKELRYALNRHPDIKAIFIPHTLGNPYYSDEFFSIIVEHPYIFMIGDCCDALGSLYDGNPLNKEKISTYSFYPAHHITMGHGGAVCTDDPKVASILRSMRDWGRACVCSPGEPPVCKNRFTGQYGDLPEGYDHKYVYTSIGYNFQITEMQAALGCSQLKRVETFEEKRRHNFDRWYTFFREYDAFFILPHWYKRSQPSWFSFPVTARMDYPECRNSLVRFLSDKEIDTRNLFAGNILKQPAYENIQYHSTRLNATDIAMNKTFFLGVYPGITDEMMDYAQDKIREFMKEYV
jgi:CDP-6-deoxy-D-xylo-4-hexulose-3-dehydrase